MLDYLKNKISPYSLLFISGAVLGVCVALPVENFVFNVLDIPLQQSLLGQFSIAAFEEILKFGPVLIALYFTKEWTTKKIIWYSVLSAAGFGLMEAITYSIRELVLFNHFGVFWPWYVCGQIIKKPLMHIIWTIVPGLSIALNKDRWIAPTILWFIIGVILHTLNNVLI